MSSSKPRTKTFTGCWTCRKRHVKCDEQRPHCLRCRRSGWACQGYSVRLGWTNTDATMAQQRRQVRIASCASPELSPRAVAAVLADLDQCSVGDGLQRGPFSVFSVSSPRQTSPSSQELIEKDSAESSSWSVAGEEQDGSPSTATSSMLTPLRVLEDPPDESTVDHQDNLMLAPVAVPVKSPIGSIPYLLNPTPMKAPEIELIHHWVVFLSGHMLLIDTPDNPCRTVFMPLALEGLHVSPQVANMHRAVFHAICAASAFSLFHLGDQTRFQSLAVSHDQLALRHLRETLQVGRRLDETMLAAVLSCITAEAMSGRRGRWRAHVAGGLGLLENAVQTGWTQTPTTMRLLQSYLSLSSLCNLRLSSQLASLLDGPPEIRHYLERSHGVTASLVRFLARISLLRDSLETVTPAELDYLELQLYLQFPRVPDMDTPEAMVIQLALNSFYYATVIHFRRTLRHAPLSEVQDLVEKAVQDLEAAETLTHNGGCAYNWASFVVAAECERPDLQARTLALFESKRRHGIQNIQVLCEIVQTLWQRRHLAGPGVDIHWEEIASQEDFDIMLV